VNGELGSIWNEQALALLEGGIPHLPGGTEENHEKILFGTAVPGRDLSPEPPE
jgi:hypothetical protein